MIKINLLHPEKKDIPGGAGETAVYGEEEREPKLNTGAAIGALILTAGIIGVMYFTQASTIDRKQKKLTERKARKAELDVVLKTLEELERTRDQLARKVKIIEDLKSKQQDAVKMMDILCSALPEHLWLKSIDYNGGSVSLTGNAFTNVIIADFINNLKSTNHFIDVKFPGSSRVIMRGLSIYSFRLTCRFIAQIPKKKVV